MPPPGCPLCAGKWTVGEGGVCQICRTVDRLAALVRGPDLPSEAGHTLLLRLREYHSEILDLGEVSRGVVPDPAGNTRVEEPKPGPPGAAAKVLPGPSSERHRDREAPSPSTRAESSHRRREKPKKEKRHTPKDSSPSRERGRKRTRGSRASREEDIRLASPVRVPGAVKSEEESSSEPEERKEKKRRPEPPDYPPPGRERERSRRREEPEDDRRPRDKGRGRGRGWRGPIKAWTNRRDEPAPGQGKHFGKNKGVGKKLRDKRYWGGSGRDR